MSSRLPLPRIVFPVVPEGATLDRVDNDEADEEYNVDDSHPLPIMLEVIKKPGFARLAIEAQGIWFITP